MSEIKCLAGKINIETIVCFENDCIHVWVWGT